MCYGYESCPGFIHRKATATRLLPIERGFKIANRPNAHYVVVVKVSPITAKAIDCDVKSKAKAS